MTAVQEAVESRCKRIGRFVNVVVNYDSFRMDDSVYDANAKMIRYLEKTYYATVTRYTTSAFMRAKLGEELEKRDVVPHVFETADEAREFLSQVDPLKPL